MLTSKFNKKFNNAIASIGYRIVKGHLGQTEVQIVLETLGFLNKDANNQYLVAEIYKLLQTKDGNGIKDQSLNNFLCYV